MCRWLAYSGDPIALSDLVFDTRHSLIDQSIAAHFSGQTTNGDGFGIEPHVLPVPLPAERRNVDTDFEHLAGRLRCVVRERGRVVFEGTSELAGLEVGSLPGRG